MKNNVIRNILRFVLLIAFQALVLNRINFGLYVSPFLFVLAILMLPTNTNKMAMLAIAFAAGLVVDVSANVLGFNTFCCTLVAFLRILFADKILTRGEDVTVETPCFLTVGFQQFGFYAFLLFLLYNFAYYTLVYFSFRDLGRLLLSTILSTLVVWVMALLYQALLVNRKSLSN